MHSLPYYTINASLLDSEDGFNMGDAKLNILVNDLNELTPQLYKILAALKSEYIISFSASIVRESNLNQDLLVKIYLLMVLNFSLKGQKVFPVFSNDKLQEELLGISKMRTYLNQQGISEILFPVFNCCVSKSQIKEKCLLRIIEDEMVIPVSEALINSDSITTTIIASRDAITGFISGSDCWRQRFLDEKSTSFTSAMSQGYIEKEEVELERNLWKSRALLYQDFLSLSKRVQEKEYYEVINWYHNEYEALPLWYKQFGHIIKVIMGKRSFRSLFNDNVKKYKD